MWFGNVLWRFLKGLVLIVAVLIVAVQCSNREPYEREQSDDPVANMDWTPRG